MHGPYIRWMSHRRRVTASIGHTGRGLRGRETAGKIPNFIII